MSHINADITRNARVHAALGDHGTQTLRVWARMAGLQGVGERVRAPARTLTRSRARSLDLSLSLSLARARAHTQTHLC